MAASARRQGEVAARRAQVLQLRAAGASFQQIADTVGHKTASAAVQDLTRALAARNRELQGGAGLAVTLELERLDHLERVTQNLLRTAAAPGAGQDPLMALRAVDRLLRIGQHRAGLLHLGSLPAAPPNADGPAAAGPGELDEIAARRAHRRAASNR